MSREVGQLYTVAKAVAAPVARFLWNFEVHGELSLHGVTKPVVLDVEYTGKAVDHYGNERIAFSASAAIDRLLCIMILEKLPNV